MVIPSVFLTFLLAIVLKDQIEKSKTHLEQYKSISAAIETSLKEQSLAAQTYKENVEKRLEETTQGMTKHSVGPVSICEQLEENTEDFQNLNWGFLALPNVNFCKHCMLSAFPSP